MNPSAPLRAGTNEPAYAKASLGFARDKSAGRHGLEEADEDPEGGEEEEATGEEEELGYNAGDEPAGH